MNEIWAIILAAGASTRMKKQKMLLPFNGKTIIETVVENAARSLNSNIVVVLGSHAEAIQNKIDNYSVKFCVNENYLDGMLSSAICGFRALPKEAKAALIFLGDQPQIPSQATDLVIEAWHRSKKGIVMPTFKKPKLNGLTPKKDCARWHKNLKMMFTKWNVICPKYSRTLILPKNMKLKSIKIN